ncbi:hypothetical protein EV646_114119 [Kribbella antiqua]|uniref:Uncharacterized protein n=1 Tax=Kribbella antiqua TaxID=2512217 RepID=A0A4R2IDP8_9ACTN|nr:hypothetical protein [Kribbella antiqua]TCO42296.1 hypothetical protein EV646_114119 [Kribbella antiqua]
MSTRRQVLARRLGICRPRLSAVLLVVGAFAASVATAWTVVLPLLTMLLIFLRLTASPKPQ